ncbi:MAG TPA: DUF4157 domain-containing protein [Pyrinomonadaceae bacterium]|nr:DUF4157 domain-containing protein [Pyrinomonadaceae bacterium]
MDTRAHIESKKINPAVVTSMVGTRKLQRACACGQHTIGGGDCESCRRESDATTLRRATRTSELDARNSAGAAPIVHEVLRTSGQPLDAATREFFEPRFGHDFSAVRVHTDGAAAQSARAVNALAYTVGSNVVFGTNQYNPHSSSGRQLLAHELAHTVQQSALPARAIDQNLNGPAHDAFEKEADRAAEGSLANRQISLRTTGPLVQRKDLTPEEFATKALTAGPADKKEKATFEKAGKAAADVEKKGTVITRVEIPAAGRDDGVKGLTSKTFASEFAKCPTARTEAGLPKAFLCATNEIAFPQLATDNAATTDTNVRVGMKEGKGGGSVWVTSASLPWTLNTAGFLDIEAIDSKMLKSYETHEKGHRTIAVQIRGHLSKLMQAELESALPTEQKPLTKSGKDFAQQGVNALVDQISKVRTRYMKWFDELSATADSGWDTQEKASLSKIAAANKAKEFTPGSGPEVP